MLPDERDLDEEIRGHLALSVKERIERGDAPKAARLAALREFGYIPAIRDSMRRVWYSRGLDAALALGQDMRVGLRSLLRAKGLAATVVVTLALGIGANAAIFSVVRGVLLRPLVNRGEDRLVQLVTIDGVTQVLLVSAAGATSVAPADGKQLWQHQWRGFPIVQPALTADATSCSPPAEKAASAASRSRTAPADGPWKGAGARPG